MSQQVDAATVTSQEAEAATGMSQEVSERGTGGAIFAGTLLIIGSAIWMLEGLAGIVRGPPTSSANYWISMTASTWQVSRC